MNSATYACCYIPRFPAKAVVRLRPHLRSLPIAVLDGHGSLAKICSYNEPASLLGVSEIVTPAQARMLGPIRFLNRSELEEDAAHNALLECLGHYSPWVQSTLHGTALLGTVDISGTERLHGPPEQLVQKMLQQMDLCGLPGSVVVSRNIDAANSLARFGRSLVVEEGKEKVALSTLPLWVLELTASQQETLAHWGMCTLEELARLPVTSLSARLGQEGWHLHQRASGKFENKFAPQEKVPGLSESLSLEDPVLSLEAIYVAVDLLLEQILLRVTYRGSAIESLCLEIGSEIKNQLLTITPALPCVSKKTLLKLLELRIEADAPQSPVRQITLSATPAKPKRSALSLFATEVADVSKLDVTIARIRAVVGQDRVGQPQLENTHHPDKFYVQSYKAEGGTRRQNQKGFIYRQVRPQETIRVETEKSAPKLFVLRSRAYSVLQAYGPWELTGDWWSLSSWGYMQWDVVANCNGDKIACRLVQDCSSRCWKLDGVYD